LDIGFGHGCFAVWFMVVLSVVVVLLSIVRLGVIRCLSVLIGNCACCDVLSEVVQA
jgi:hypothetical protein